MAVQAEVRHVRLAELVSALSLGIDLGFGQPMEHILRQCLIALRLAERLDLDEQARSDVYYTSLLVNVGCHSDAHEQAKWFGDDIALKATKYDHEPGSLGDFGEALRRLGAGSPILERVRLGVVFAAGGHREVQNMLLSHVELAAGFAEQLGLTSEVANSLRHAYERWDGRGWPHKLEGEEIALAARIAQLAEFVEVANRGGGIEAATALARKRRGTQFDPALVDVLLTHAEEILGDLDSVQTWDAVIGAEPALAIVLSGDRVDGALEAVANFAGLKSTYSLGHSRAVADLAADAGRGLGLEEPEAMALRRAGFVHDLGRLGVSNAIWEKPGPLGAGEWERVRIHPYLTERMLQSSPSLAPLGALASQHSERMDGSGYPRGLSGAAISRPARVLAAADAYQAMTEPRPYRPALSADEAATELRAEVKAGRVDAEAADAVLAAAGHRVGRRREGPAGLTRREIDVLVLLARGLSNKQIAQRLVISPKTASNHVEHIYAKIGASTRAAASLFAVQHGLLPDLEPAAVGTGK
ncbi:MAG: HD domain-containing phosphohydrolase [Thermoleophilaceae bacterium]